MGCGVVTMRSKIARSNWRQGCRAQRGKTLRERFDEKCSSPTESGCVLWVGANDKDGYGLIRIDGKNVKAHRVALSWKLGRPLVAGEQALHECDTPACVAEAHLKPGDNSVNQTDASKRGRCRSQRLTADDVISIRVRRSSESLSSLAKSFGVSDGHIARICSGHKWKHVGAAA